MGADNWAQCPQCVKNEADRIPKLKEQLEADYGKIPSEEFLTRTNEIRLEESKVLQDTLREDFQIGIYEDEFIVKYSCRCSECGFEYKYSTRTEGILKARGQVAPG